MNAFLKGQGFSQTCSRPTAGLSPVLTLPTATLRMSAPGSGDVAVSHA